VAPFAQRRKVWLTLTTDVPCGNAANIGERKTWTQSEICSWQSSVRGQEPPKMYIHRVSEKNCANFFLSEVRQISTNFDNFWQKDGKEAKIV